MSQSKLTFSFLLITVCSTTQLFCSQSSSSSNISQKKEPFYRWIRNAPPAPYTGKNIPTLHELAFEKLKGPLLNGMQNPKYPDFFEVIANITPTHECFHNHPDLLKKIALNYKKNPDSEDQSPANMHDFPLYAKQKSDILLHRAIQEDQPVVIEYLRENGFSVNAKDNDGSTPAHCAAWNNADKVVQLLITAGADINAKDNDDWTPAHNAARNDADKVMQLLISTRADINAKDDDGETPVHFAAWNNSEKTMQLLIPAGADINTKNKDGQTPAHCAARNNRDKNIQLLISAGANINAKDSYGRTPLDITNTESPIYQMLRNAGAKHSNEL